MNNQHSPHTPTSAVRLAWTALLATVRYAVEEQLGSAVVTATSQPSGFSLGVAAKPTSRRWPARLFESLLGPKPNPTSPVPIGARYGGRWWFTNDRYSKVAAGRLR
ncbi:MAG: hypothetical protein R2867_40560 [Caldilineaceae bacterium]